MASAFEKAKQGDAQAFGDLYEIYAKDLYRFALCMLHVREDAEDAVQDAAISVYKHMLRIKKEESFRSYFFTVLANECRARLKKRENDKKVSLDDIEPILADASDENLLLSLELQQAVSKLKDEERTVVLLSSVAGFNSSQIANIMGVTNGTVRSKLSRSLRKLREELSK